MRAGGTLIGIVFLVSGWLLALGALMLLPGLQGRFTFVLAALALQLLGLGLFAFSARPPANARARIPFRSSR